MSAVANRLLKFGQASSIARHLKKHPETSYLSDATVKKAASVFANQKLTHFQIRHKVLDVMRVTTFKSRDDASNAYSDLVSALEDKGK